MSNVVTCIEDLRLLAKRRVPRMFYDYVDSGSWTEGTYRANSHDFEAIKLRQRIAVDVADRTLASTMIGQPVDMPVALAPVGLLGMQRADGELLAARAAAKAGIPFTLSTMSICSIEDVAAHSDRPFWFQLYVMRDHDFTNRLIDRAREVGCSALVLTLDLQILGQRYKDLRNGLSTPPKPTLANIINLATKPRWCWHMLKTRRRSFGNIHGHLEGATNMRSISVRTALQFEPKLCWDDIKRFQDRWKGKLILKGILDPEDAKSAIGAGADAIVVSNHGGRQLDGALSSIGALPAIVDVVGRRTEILMDGGIRSGQDVIKALACGAKGVMLGRSFAYGLGADGEKGVSQALDIIRRDLDVTMALCGLRDVRDVNRSIIAAPSALAGGGQADLE